MPLQVADQSEAPLRRGVGGNCAPEQDRGFFGRALANRHLRQQLERIGVRWIHRQAVLKHLAGSGDVAGTQCCGHEAERYRGLRPGVRLRCPQDHKGQS